jgi:Trypsin-like peptidase domain
MPKSRGRGGQRHRKKFHRHRVEPHALGPSADLVPVNIIDLHFPVLALKRGVPKAETSRPIVYGTAFPIGPGVLLTAGHVWEAAFADGIPILSKIPVPGGTFRPLQVDDAELFRTIDVALISCPALGDVMPLPLDFDRRLAIGDPAYAIGFPMAVDAEWVSIVHRGFTGHVITRREMYHIPGQPPGYELSFYAPQGLSGAPLVSHVGGDHRCYGYIVQQSTISAGRETTPIGIAVDIVSLLALNSKILRGPVAHHFGREPIVIRATPPQRPGGVDVVDISVEGWPDEPADTE